MEVASTLNVGDPLTVATAVTLGEGVVDSRDGVKRLMEVSNVVDDQTEGKGLLVVDIIERVSDLVDVGAVGVDLLSLEESNQVVHGLDDVDISHHVIGVVSDGFALVEERLINEMPIRLERVALSLDVVGEIGTLSEGVALFVTGQRRLGGLEVSKHFKGGIERGGASKDRLSLSGDYKVKAERLASDKTSLLLQHGCIAHSIRVVKTDSDGSSSDDTDALGG